MSFSSVSMVVDGQEVSLELDDALAIGELTGDMTSVAAQMAYWGAVWAAAESERDRAEAHYRHWRADQVRMLLEANDKLSEWKVKGEIEGCAAYLEIKDRLALSTRNAILCKSIVDAFRVKANLLQSRGALARAEMESTGLHTKSNSTKSRKKPSVRAARQEEKREERKSAVRELFRKKVQQ